MIVLLVIFFPATMIPVGMEIVEPPLIVFILFQIFLVPVNNAARYLFFAKFKVCCQYFYYGYDHPNHNYDNY